MHDGIRIFSCLDFERQEQDRYSTSLLRGEHLLLLFRMGRGKKISLEKNDQQSYWARFTGEFFCIRNDVVHTHFKQAGIQQRQQRILLSHLRPATEEKLEKIKIDHILLPLYLLSSGLIISIIQFLIEKFCYK